MDSTLASSPSAYQLLIQGWEGCNWLLIQKENELDVIGILMAPNIKSPDEFCKKVHIHTHKHTYKTTSGTGARTLQSSSCKEETCSLTATPWEDHLYHLRKAMYPQVRTELLIISDADDRCNKISSAELPQSNYWWRSFTRAISTLRKWSDGLCTPCHHATSDPTHPQDGQMHKWLGLDLAHSVPSPDRDGLAHACTLM